MRKIVAFLFVAGTVLGQDFALARLKHEMAVAREQSERAQQFGKDGAARIAAVHLALRDWLEPQLPHDLYSVARDAWRLEPSLTTTLTNAGLSKSGSADRDMDFDGPAFAEVGFEFKTMPEMPNILIVTAGVRVPCGRDEAVYANRFDSVGRTRVIEDHPKSDWGYEDAKFELSDPDSQGRRLFLVHRSNIQCGSSWKDMTYAVYRMNSAQPPEALFSANHDFWMGNEDGGRIFVLRPDELIIEFLDRSVDMGIHNRTHIFRYNFTNGVHRIGPFAFQPQDFVEEWLASSSSEVKAMSSPGAGEWHRKLRKLSFDHYFEVVACVAKPGRWSIGL